MIDTKLTALSTAQILALEYAKAKMTPDTTPEQFANIYIAALSRISPLLKGF